MNYNIRHIILPMMTVLACAVVSCTSDSFSEDFVSQSQEEMTFEVAGSTRTITTTNENIINQPFMLFGDIKLDERLDSIFYWQPVKFNGTKWDYGVPQYWFMGHEHSFVAIHPFIPQDDPQVTILTYEDSELSFTYTLPEKLEEAKDLLFATHRRKYSLDNAGPIQFEFTHLLPRINISMALIEDELMYGHVDENDTENNPYNKNEYIAVHSVEFQNIKTKASFTFTPKALTTGSNSTSDYDYKYLIRDDDRVDTVVVTLEEACKVPNSYKEGVDDYEIEYVTALKGNEIIVMLPQSFDAEDSDAEDSDAEEAKEEPKIVVNYSINEDKDLLRRIVIPLKGTEWKAGKSYTYKFLINNAYYNHIVDKGVIIVDIDDFRLHGEHEDEDEAGDDSWITDTDDPNHNIKYGYDDAGNCGPVNEPENKEE